MRARIHCCCDAHLIGTCELSNDLSSLREITFPLRDGSLFTMEVDNIAMFGVRYRALKSREYPMEILRQLPDFQPPRDEDFFPNFGAVGSTRYPLALAPDMVKLAPAPMPLTKGESHEEP